MYFIIIMNTHKYNKVKCYKSYLMWNSRNLNIEVLIVFKWNALHGIPDEIYECAYVSEA